jgi:hypothetical protein
MSFQRWSYDFDGAYTSSDQLRPIAGVYVVWCRVGDRWTVLDVGETDDVRGRLNNHERAGCWRRNCNGVIYYSATYTGTLNEEGRRNIEREIREAERPPCGER